MGADVDLSDLAARCPAHVTGADLYALCSEALLESVRQLVLKSERGGEGEREGEGEGEGEGEKLVVSADHFQLALSQLTPSVTPAELERYQKLRHTKVSS